MKYIERSKDLQKKGEKIMTKRFGFTLAEVLITLGIIGVVAAMTMPTLINQTNGAQYKAAYKKALSAISQAVTLNVALEDYSFADLSGQENVGNGRVVDLLKKRMNTVDDQPTTDIVTNRSYAVTKGGNAETGNLPAYSVSTSDGIMFMFEPNAAGCTKDTPCRGVIDVNGVKGPNKFVTCDGNGDAADCIVKSPTDVYEVTFFDQTIAPADDAAKAVLYGK